jgi:MFS family permease
LPFGHSPAFRPGRSARAQLRPLRHRAVHLAAGDWIELTAVSWILYELTNSPLLLGLSGVFRALPVIVLGLFGGAIADRVPRRPLLVFTESTMWLGSLTIGVLAATGSLQFWHLYILNVVSGTLSASRCPRGRRCLLDWCRGPRSRVR